MFFEIQKKGATATAIYHGCPSIGEELVEEDNREEVAEEEVAREEVIGEELVGEELGRE
jgi:hypothetical protein